MLLAVAGQIWLKSKIRHKDFSPSVCPSVWTFLFGTLRVPPLEFETGWTGELSQDFFGSLDFFLILCKMFLTFRHFLKDFWSFLFFFFYFLLNILDYFQSY